MLNAVSGKCSPLGQLKRKKPLAKPKKTHVGQQVMEFSSLQSSGEEEILTPTKMRPVFYESDSKGEDDPIVCCTIIAVMAMVEILVSSSGVRGILSALLDSGCLTLPG